MKLYLNGENMKKSFILTLFLIASLSLIIATDVKADTDKYHYESDTERWYYEKVSYETPRYHVMPYQYYYNATHYSTLFYPYYTIGYSYRNVKVYEYHLTIKTDLPEATVTGEGWYKQGNSASISASHTVEADDKTKYHFSHWSGDFSGGSISSTITMDKAKTVVANYLASYHILAQSNPSEVLGFIEDSWYEKGTVKVFQSAPEIVKSGQSKRYVFESWYINGMKVAGNPISNNIDEPLLIEAKYKTQYYLTVESLYGYPQGSGWYDENSEVTFQVTTPIDSGFGKKWVFEQWSGDTVTSSPQGKILMDSPKTINALWILDSTILHATYAIIIISVITVVTVTALYIIRKPRTSISVPYSTQLCPGCGYQLAEPFKFCPICGYKKKQSKSR